MRIEKNIKGELNFYTLKEKIKNKKTEELLYHSLVNLYPFDSEKQDLDKYMEFVQSEVRALLTTELT